MWMNMHNRHSTERTFSEQNATESAWFFRGVTNDPRWHLDMKANLATSCRRSAPRWSVYSGSNYRSKRGNHSRDAAGNNLFLALPILRCEFDPYLSSLSISIFIRWSYQGRIPSYSILIRSKDLGYETTLAFHLHHFCNKHLSIFRRYPTMGSS